MAKAAVNAEIRGFSFMPENKMEATGLQYVEGEDLERTWKSSRRQRLKQQEQKIWEDFIKEQDILKTVCTDDPYQFLEHLPESCLKELMEVELTKMKKEMLEETKNIEDQKPEGDGDMSRGSSRPEELITVTFADEVEMREDNCEVFHIFDDEKDEDKDDLVDEQSGPEDEVHNESSSPCTVRERGPSPPAARSPRSPHSPHSQRSPRSPRSPNASPPALRSPHRDGKASENMTNMIESSIYCAKVKELRPKIIEEMLSIMESLEQRDILGIEPEELAKMCRRSTEFCARFNRIYMYQLHRQLHDIKRNSSVSLPFARHTHFQSQMVRIVSLHQNLLQSLQVFHRSLAQTGIAGEGAALLRSLLQLCTTSGAAARAAPTPPALRHHIARLYTDDMAAVCDRLDHVVTEYSTRMTACLSTTNKTDSSRSKKTSITTSRKKNKGGSKKKTDTDSRLSMYSLDTLRINLRTKSSSSKDNQSIGTSKVGGGLTCNGRKADPAQQQPPKSSRKSPRHRRPLMRAPGCAAAGGPRARARAPRDADVRTMVEAVTPEPCNSSYMSREVSPRQSGQTSKVATPQRSRNQTPRIAKDSPSKKSPERFKSKRNFSPKSPKSPKKPTSPKSLRSPALVIPPIPDSHSIESMPKILTMEKNTVKVISPKMSPRPVEEVVEMAERERNESLQMAARCEVSRIVRQLCGGDAVGSRERVSGMKNAQLHCIVGGSPRQPSTPQLLKILEETIQKKVPKTPFHKTLTANKMERFRLALNLPERTAERMFQYRTKFVQHMLASPMYANCSIGKPWEMVGSIADQLIDDLLVQCSKEMELNDVVQELYKVETR